MVQRFISLVLLTGVTFVAQGCGDAPSTRAEAVALAQTAIDEAAEDERVKAHFAEADSAERAMRAVIDETRSAMAAVHSPYRIENIIPGLGGFGFMRRNTDRMVMGQTRMYGELRLAQIRSRRYKALHKANELVLKIARESMSEGQASAVRRFIPEFFDSKRSLSDVLDILKSDDAKTKGT